jgi:hypothetical protein
VNSIANKLYLVAIIAIIILWIIAYAIVYGRNKQLSAENAALKMSLVECQIQQNVIASAIERQNAAIEAVKIDTLYVERETQSIVTRYSVVRDTVTKNMERDSSAENMLYNIVDVLRNFHGVGLRSARDN